MNYKEQLGFQLRAMGIKSDDTLLVHTSMKGLGCNGLLVDDVIKALIELVCDGTLLVPALSYMSVTKENPCFDAAKTKTCIGVLPEVFRTNYATNRSVHPTHSVCAIGKLASSITSAHKLDNTPLGKHSPFRLLESVGGKILMLGCSLLPNTFMHGVEEAANATYPLAKEPIKYTLTVGNESHTKDYFPHEFGNLIQRYDRLADLLSESELVAATVLNGTAFLIDAQAAMREGINAIQHKDNFFVE